MRWQLAVMASLLVQPANVLAAPACTIDRDRVFPGDGEHVRLARQQGLAATANFGLFRARLAVNTDGAPTSYHPRDFYGRQLAINAIENGITIRRSDGVAMTSAQRKAVFERWRDNGWVVPQGYGISWQSVIAATPGGRPCLFTSGSHQGYFGSLTATKNGVPPGQAGECAVNDQLDQRYIPAIVLRGPAINPLTGYGARKGDLVVAVNPATSPPTIVPAIIGDTGNARRIGEGSVALNRRLLGMAAQPQTYTQAVGLDTGSRQMIVAVLPGTGGFQPARPYSAANIAARVQAWAQARGYGSLAGLADAMAGCAQGL
jgi:hypothetical protein